MSLLVMIFALLCGATAQAVLPSWTLLGTARPPVLLSVALYYAMTRDRKMMLTAALLAGLLQDALSLIPLGYSSILFVVVASMVSRFRELVFVYRGMTHLILGAMASAVVTLGLGALLVLNGQISFYAAGLLSRMLGALVIGALLTPVIFRIIEFVDVHLGNIEGMA